jgi:hypothetical protein
MREVDAPKDDPRRFRIIYPSSHRDHGADVMGGPCSRNNAYISIYPAIQEGQPSVDELEVGQHTKAYYSLSGSKPIEYWIVRLEDEEKE